MNEILFSDLLGKTFISIDGLEKQVYAVTFNCSDGSKYLLKHKQECCEDVCIEDVIGDVNDIIESEILLAEEVSGETPSGYIFEDEPESYQWTFYKLSTINGSITIRWLGTSNGYYSEDVSLFKLE